VCLSVLAMATTCAKALGQEVYEVFGFWWGGNRREAI
jgi:hypothetical protein